MARQKLDTEIKVGLFVLTGLILTMLSIILLSGTGDWFTSNRKYAAHFSNVEGLITGAKVILSGVNVGTIESVELDPDKHDIRVSFTVSQKASRWVRQDSSVEIATQGVLGDKFISIKAGSANLPELPDGAVLNSQTPRDLGQFINKGDALMGVLNRIASNLDRIFSNFETDQRSEVFFKSIASAAKNLSDTTVKLNQQMNDIQIKNAVSQLNQIFEKLNNGTGTLGALINDPSLYDEIRAVVGGVNRNRVFRNLIRQTIKDSETGKPASESSKK